jgi:drug/metabolite transporter (DMT)-like permease
MSTSTRAVGTLPDAPVAGAADAAARNIICAALETYAYVGLWIVLSAAVILFNKYILSVYGFPFPVALTMVHMAFCSALAFVIVRVLKWVPASDVSAEVYWKKIAPIAGLFALSLWASNTAYIYLSVAFIQMLKALSPVTVYTIGCVIGIEKYTHARFGNMAVVTLGVMISSFGELNFNAFGFCVQLVAVLAEACRIVSVQLVLGKANLKLNSITTLYYVSPACFAFLLVPFALLELPRIAYGLEITHSVHYSTGIMLANAMCAFALNSAIYLLIGKTSALTLNVAGVVKDFFLIIISAAVFESPISATQLIGFSIAAGGVFYYNYAKFREAMDAQQQQKAVEDPATVAKKSGENQA